jgi:hypothetical protein
MGCRSNNRKLDNERKEGRYDQVINVFYRERSSHSSPLYTALLEPYLKENIIGGIFDILHWAS